MEDPGCLCDGEQPSLPYQNLLQEVFAAVQAVETGCFPSLGWVTIGEQGYHYPVRI